MQNKEHYHFPKSFQNFPIHIFKTPLSNSTFYIFLHFIKTEFKILYISYCSHKEIYCHSRSSHWLGCCTSPQIMILQINGIISKLTPNHFKTSPLINSIITFPLASQNFPFNFKIYLLSYLTGLHYESFKKYFNLKESVSISYT